MYYPGSLGGEEKEWKKLRMVLGPTGEDSGVRSRPFGAMGSTPEECIEKGDEACEELEHNEKNDLGAMKIRSG